MGLLRRFRNRFLWATPNNAEKTAAQLDAINGQLRMIDERLGRMEGRLDELYQRIEQADAGINGNLDHKCDAVLFPALFELKDAESVHSLHRQMFDWELYRRQGESLEAAKKRFFREMPAAKGQMRLFQLADAELLRALDEICAAHAIPYWLEYGTLVGAVLRNGFIPWDDDVDVGMMRGDIERLKHIVNTDPELKDRYRIVVVYDNYAKCVQVRFRFTDPNLPNFVDLSMFDYAPEATLDLFDRQLEIRQAMIDEMETDSALDAWREKGYCDEGDEVSVDIAALFEKAGKRLRDQGIIATEETGCIIWGYDNQFNEKSYKWICLAGDIFPVQRIEFEGMQCSAPRNPMKFLTEHYGDIYELPDDILTHTHFYSGELEDRLLSDRLRGVLGQDARERT